MPVTDQASFVEYAGNESTSTGYPITFPYFDDTDITVYVDNLPITTFTVVADEVITSIVVSAASTLRIARAVPYDQSLDLVLAADFPSTLAEKAWDRAVMMAQQVRDLVNSALRFPSGEAMEEMPSKTDMTENYVYFDDAGEPVARTAAEIAADVLPELNLESTTPDKSTATCADAAARAALTPDFSGQLLIQLDNFGAWIANGLTAGDWQSSDLSAVQIIDATTSRILAVTDRLKWLRFTSGSAVTVTVNTAIFATDDIIFIEQAGAGTVTINGTAVIENGAAWSDATAGQYSVIGLHFSSATTATLFGDRAPV